MRNLIVLCAGDHMINNQPLFLMRHPDGQFIAEKVIDGIFAKYYDRIIYVIPKDVNDIYFAGEKILSNIGNKFPVEILTLSNKTRGPAETTYEAIKGAKINGELTIRDSHSYIKINEEVHGNFVAGLDIVNYDKTIENLRSKSFIITNEQNQVLDIVEKRFRSDVISCGLYGIKSATDFVMAYEKLSDPNYMIRKLYISHIISYLIGYSKMIYHCIDSLEFEDWSTVNSWTKIQRKYATYFLDMDAVCGIKMPFDDKVLDLLKKSSASGSRYIFYTSNKDIDKDMIIRYLSANGINILNLISGCTYSKVKSIINSREMLYESILEG